MLRDAIISGAHNIYNERLKVDELNVFPVPDGDTGTNMSMTSQAAAKELPLLEADRVGDVAAASASAMLRGARGNSGVILSLLFRGFAGGLKGKETATAQDIADALKSGVESAYKAVMKPTEGTMLTVARESAEKAAEMALQTNDPVLLWEAVTEQARQTLARTPELLPVLKKAGVVDAGGRGLVIIYEGMLQVFKGQVPVEAQQPQTARPQTVIQEPKTDYEGDIEFGYCTEYIVVKDKNLDKDALTLRAHLESFGDCVVVVDDDDIIKVHVHSNEPQRAIGEGIQYGQLTNIKIDNMRMQNEALKKEAAVPAELVNVPAEKLFGFVAVAAGNGIETLFADLGVDRIVRGGQTMNPSTDDILRAIAQTPSEIVFVLPNNKNIIMAAEQAVALAEKKVCVLQTRTIPQGISAMLAFDSDADFNENRVNMTNAIDKVSTGQVTFAARDSEYDGHDIKKGEILALDNGKLAFLEKDVSRAAYRLTKRLANSSTSFVTLIYGADVTDDQAEATCEQIQNKLGSNIEVTLINGGQPVYYYIISVE